MQSVQMQGWQEKSKGRVTSRVYGGVLVVVAFVCSLLGYFYGGYYVTEWALVAFFFAALLAAAALMGVLGGARTWWSVAATTLLICYTAWTFASIFWSPNRGDAWLGSGITLLYLLAFWVTTTLVALEASRRWTLAVLSIGPGIVAMLTLPRLVSEYDSMFLDGRLLGTLGYFNAEAAFLVMSLWVSVYVSSSPRMHPVLRGLALTSAVASLEVAVLTQSRGAMVALIVSVPVFFLLSGRRMRGMFALLPIVASLALSFPALNDVFISATETGSDASSAGAVIPTILATSLVSGVYGFAWGLLDARWRPSGTLLKVAGGITLVCLAGFIVAGSFVFVSRVGNPVAWAEDGWVSFKSDAMTGEEASRYLSASGSGRYTLWEVAWKDFSQKPLVGVGTHNYESTYYQQRDTLVGWVHQPHSLPLEVLAERGIIGGLLFFGFLGVCAAAGFWKRFSQLNAEGKAQVAAILASLAYWFVHSGAEWFWQIPAVTLPAVIYLAMLVAPWTRRNPDEPVYSPSHRPLRLAGAGLAILTLITLTPLYAAERLREKADREDNPWAAIQTLQTAQRINPLDPELTRREADLAYQIGDIPLATQSYARAIELNPYNYANYSVLGGVYEQLGQTDRALELYKRSLELNRLDPTLQENVTRLEGEEQASSE